jgi:thioredoxin reductase
VQDQRFGFLSPSVESLDFALFLRGWTGDVAVLTDGRYAVPPEMGERLTGGGVRVEERRIARLSAKRLSANDIHLDLIEFTDGDPLPLDVLFARPPQRQVAVVQALGLDLDSGGYVRLDERRQTSIPGIFAGGDLITSAQSAVLAAASGVQAAAMINHELTLP